MNNARRIEVYLSQTGRDTGLTPAQRRRVRKRQNVAVSPLASVRRASRLRKVTERKHRRELRATGEQLVAIVHALRKRH